MDTSEPSLIPTSVLEYSEDDTAADVPIAVMDECTDSSLSLQGILIILYNA